MNCGINVQYIEFLYDKSQCKNKWSSDFKSLCNLVGMSGKFNTMIEWNVNKFTMNIKANYDNNWRASSLKMTIM